MSQENVDLAREIMDAWNAEDLAKKAESLGAKMDDSGGDGAPTTDDAKKDDGEDKDE